MKEGGKRRGGRERESESKRFGKGKKEKEGTEKEKKKKEKKEKKKKKVKERTLILSVAPSFWLIKTILFEPKGIHSPTSSLTLPKIKQINKIIKIKNSNKKNKRTK